MISILVLAALVFAVLLFNVMARLKLVERELAERRGEAPERYVAPSPPQPVSPPIPAPQPLAAEQPARRVARVVRSSAPAEPAPEVPVAPFKSAQQADPTPEPAFVPEPPASPAFGGFENLVGGRLPIWIGGAALILAAFFLVRYSIESGLLDPAVRAILGALFGLILLAGSEVSRRLPTTADDPRIGQALAGAGIAILYGTLYMASELLGLVPALPAFALMILITVAALGLSLRHGPPTAIMGLIGGFAAPLVTGIDAAGIAPLLIYLALFTAGLFALAIHRGWLWLALAATGGGLIWPLALIAVVEGSQLPFVGLFVLTLALAATLVLPRAGGESRLLRLAPLITGLIQLLLIAPRMEFSPLAWGLYGLLAAAALWLGWRDSRLSIGAGAALGLALALLTIALAGGDVTNAPLAAIAFTVLFGGAGHALARREPDGRLWSIVALGGTAGPLLVTNLLQSDLLAPWTWALLSIVAAAAQASLSWRSRADASPELRISAGLTGGAAGAALLAATGLAQPLATSWLPALLLAIAVALAAWARRSGDRMIERISLVPLPFAALVWPATSDHLDLYVDSVFATGPMPSPLALLSAALLPAVALAAHAWLLRDQRARYLPHWAAFLVLLTLPLALVPAGWHAPVLALLAAATFAPQVGKLLPRHGTAAAILAAALAMLPTLASVAELLVQSLAGNPLPYTYLAPLTAILREIGLPAAILAAALALRPTTFAGRVWTGLIAAIAAALGIALYALVKQPLAIDTLPRFVTFGLLERVVITHALFAAALALLAFLPRYRAIGLGLLALASFRLVWFDLLLLNPLAEPQNVGSLPLLNLAAGHLGLSALWLWLAAPRTTSPRIPQGASLALTALATAAAVRQFAQGPLLTAPRIGVTENYLYSAALLALALIWLWRGISGGSRALRLVGLALLTLVTLKVFLVDASALQGILRILSFLGLGLALMAIGWGYGRFLGGKTATAP